MAARWHGGCLRQRPSSPLERLHPCIQVYVALHVYLYMHTYIHIYIHINTCVHGYIYIYVYVIQMRTWI